MQSAWHEMSSNDEVERRGASRASNEGTLSQSSTPLLAHRRRHPRSLEPLVRPSRFMLAARSPRPISSEETRKEYQPAETNYDKPHLPEGWGNRNLTKNPRDAQRNSVHRIKACAEHHYADADELADS